MSAYTRLQIVLPSKKVNFRDFSYRLTVVDYNVTPLSETVSSGAFDASGMSARHALNKLDVEIYYDVFIQGQFAKKISCKAYPADSKLHSSYRFKATADSTHPENDHLKEVILDSTAVGWYLVKKPEPFGDLVNRIYKKPSDADWAVMAANNPHLKNATSRATMLLPGQVVVLSKSRTSPKLTQFRHDALKAQAVWEKIHAQNQIDEVYLNLLDLKLQGLQIVEAGLKLTSKQGEFRSKTALLNFEWVMRHEC
jgi:hypothetical protein